MELFEDELPEELLTEFEWPSGRSSFILRSVQGGSWKFGPLVVDFGVAGGRQGGRAAMEAAAH